MKKFKSKRQKPKVTWTNRDTAVPDAAAVKLPWYVQTKGLDNELVVAKLQPGKLFKIRFDLQPEQKVGSNFSVLERSYWSHFDSSSGIPAGSIAMYIGTIRITEKRTSNKTVESVKQTFFVSGARYILEDLNYIEPIGD